MNQFGQWINNKLLVIQKLGSKYLANHRQILTLLARTQAFVQLI